MSSVRSVTALVVTGALYLTALACLPACEKTPESSRLAPATSASAQAAARSPVSAAGRDLLGGLKQGDKLGPVEVGGVYGPDRGRLTIEVKEGEAAGILEVALQGDGPLPPVTTSKYGVFYGAPVHGVAKLPDPKLMEACQALAARIKENELKAATPAGLKSYGQRDVEL